MLLTKMYTAYRAAGGSADLSAEHGYHRLVLVSPFDRERRRYSCFALVGPEDGASSQVRAYVLDPYQLARNLFDDRRIDDVYAVLSGERLGELC